MWVRLPVPISKNFGALSHKTCLIGGNNSIKPIKSVKKPGVMRVVPAMARQKPSNISCNGKSPVESCFWAEKRTLRPCCRNRLAPIIAVRTERRSVVTRPISSPIVTNRAISMRGMIRKMIKNSIMVLFFRCGSLLLSAVVGQNHISGCPCRYFNKFNEQYDRIIIQANSQENKLGEQISVRRYYPLCSCRRRTCFLAA